MTNWREWEFCKKIVDRAYYKKVASQWSQKRKDRKANKKWKLNSIHSCQLMQIFLRFHSQMSKPMPNSPGPFT